ncbi:hypothetical protein BV898_13446 [Hypsibius exemplaris]|uniref:NADH dehydrogenase [ubiquinone] 1 beta subcomplex subunit 4 n=1 Tax=Hypsibius exemplaris TaxID=2072580 RepID=A0A1W0WAN3_HYPEX|nr:hypothetical protein BV898_13446 [Hypsibius exemplaris]
MSGAGTLQNWGRPDTYNLSEGELQLVKERAQRRVQMKAEYQRLIFNPYRHMSGDGGQPFDPLMQRFSSTRADYYHYFKPNRWNFMFLFAVWLGPVAGLSLYLQKRKWSFDEKCRKAEIPWRYRARKWQ